MISYQIKSNQVARHSSLSFVQEPTLQWLTATPYRSWTRQLGWNFDLAVWKDAWGNRPTRTLKKQVLGPIYSELQDPVQKKCLEFQKQFMHLSVVKLGKRFHHVSQLSGFNPKNRRTSLEYCFIEGWPDQVQQNDQMIRKIRSIPFHCWSKKYKVLAEMKRRMRLPTKNNHADARTLLLLRFWVLARVICQPFFFDIQIYNYNKYKNNSIHLYFQHRAVYELMM